ncbi:MAG: DUF3418 domain-containing protein, partial [Halioglobus sp.]|nr:DUF3418 domain-containing protein [Halioglobus sp.]
QREFLSYRRMREWRDIHTQLTIACRQQKLKPPALLPPEENYAAVHRALLSGLLGHIARHQEGREYQGARERKLQVFPGSSQASRKPQWIVAAEIVETSRVFAREVAAIEPRWVLDLEPAQLKRHYSEPHWRSRRGQVVALERTTLYGLTLAEKRPVHYGPLARAESRELMIREGLIPGSYHQHPAFLKHNRRLVRDIEDMESRSRRRDLLVDEQAQFTFYDERLPDDIFTASRLAAWLKKNPGAEKTLYMSREHLLARDPGAAVGGQFPDVLEWRDMRFRLSYAFEPGGVGDGVTVTVPVALLNRVPRYRFDWLVPGLLREKCIALVKSLPKQLRKHLVPVPDYVDRALAELPGGEAGDEELLTWLAARLSAASGLKLTAGDWRDVRLEDFYRMNIRVVDAAGKLLEQGRDLAALIERFREDTRAVVSARDEDSPVREGLTRWDFDALPREWRFRQAGADIVSFPALADRGDSVAIVLCDYPAQARREHRLGVLRLLRLGAANQAKTLRKQLLRGNAYNLALAAADCAREPLVEDLVNAAFAQTCNLGGELPYDLPDYEELRKKTAGVFAIASELEQNLANTLAPLGRVRQQLAALPAGNYDETLADARAQLRSLFAADFQR